MAFNTSTLSADSWQTQTMTCKIINSGNLSLGFYGISAWPANSYLDKISNVSVTPEPPKGMVILLW